MNGFKKAAILFCVGAAAISVVAGCGEQETESTLQSAATTTAQEAVIAEEPADSSVPATVAEEETQAVAEAVQTQSEADPEESAPGEADTVSAEYVPRDFSVSAMDDVIMVTPPSEPGGGWNEITAEDVSYLATQANGTRGTLVVNFQQFDSVDGPFTATAYFDRSLFDGEGQDAFSFLVILCDYQDEHYYLEIPVDNVANLFALYSDDVDRFLVEVTMAAPEDAGVEAEKAAMTYTVHMSIGADSVNPGYVHLSMPWTEGMETVMTESTTMESVASSEVTERCYAITTDLNPYVYSVVESGKTYLTMYQ